MPVFITGLSGKKVLGKVADKSIVEISTSDMYGATAVKAGVFTDCVYLQKMGIPNSVESIDLSSFSGCNSLTYITIPFVGATLNGMTNTHFGYIFGASTYSQNSSFVPASLKTVIITGGTDIRNNAFYGCSSLVSITIPDSITSIGTYAFYNCSGLTSIEIPDGVTSIGNSVLSGCSSLTSIIIPDSVTSIGNWAFFRCSSLTSIIIPDNVTNIGDHAFSGCHSLTDISIPDGITIIDVRLFDNCSSLTSITIPSSVASIGDYAFRNCSRLTSIMFNGTKAQWQAINKSSTWKNGVPATCIVHCTDGDINI